MKALALARRIPHERSRSNVVERTKKFRKKRLLITHYWYPFNDSGTFRWLNLARQIDFDVLTSKRPRKEFYDETIPRWGSRVFRYGSRLPAVLSGLYLSFRALFKRYDTYIITSPPESLIIGAFILQLLGRNVVLDMRDSIDRGKQPLKFMVPVYKFFYKRIKYVTVCWQFVDKRKTVVHSGDDNIHLSPRVNGHKPILYSGRRLKYQDYYKALKVGYVQNLRLKPQNYAASSLFTIKHLGYDIDLSHLSEEMQQLEPRSWRVQAKKMQRFLNETCSRQLSHWPRFI